ncbi:MAG: PadR family transcriptional regulator [Candidatus Lokiarchaeota archaeon]|nr:PadR family transcriptional regulator [Candidatus Lokiarchaeota archaeon]
MTEIKDIKVQNLTKLYILVLLNLNKHVTGYYIIKKLSEDLNKTVSPTYIYDFLKKLKAKEYIEDVPAQKSKRKKGYKLTPTGKEFTEKIFLRFNNLIEVAVQSKISICASCGVKLYENYHTEEINQKKMNFCCKHCASAYLNSNKSN